MQLPPCEFVPKKYNGPSYENLKNIRKDHLNPALLTFYSKPLALHQGYKQWLFDIEGKRYLDLFGGICTVSVGHCHPRITKAVNEQMSTLGHVSNIYYHPKIHEYAKRLTEKMPGELKVAYFVNSGSEANDLAILMSRVYTGNHEIVSFRNCYHGMTYQTMALTSQGSYKYKLPTLPGFHHVMNPDIFRGLWGGSKCRDSLVQVSRNCDCGEVCNAKEKYLDQFRELFKYTLPKKSVAAFFAESIQGVGGALQFPKGYIKEAYDIVKESGGLFVSDEVQTGFGRTGDHFWGFEGHEIIPDIVTMAKGIGNGYPLAAVVTTPAIAEALSRANHFNTFGGNPVASAVGITVLDIIEEEELQHNCKNVGNYLLKELEKMRDEFEVIGDVRGKGLMIGIELVEGGKRPLSSEKFLKIWEYCKDAGLLIGKGGADGNVIRLKPPMCITKEDARFGLEVMRLAFKSLN